jgi:hypothetical protein
LRRVETSSVAEAPNNRRVVDSTDDAAMDPSGLAPPHDSPNIRLEHRRPPTPPAVTAFERTALGQHRARGAGVERPAKYERKPAGRVVDAFEPQIGWIAKYFPPSSARVCIRW